VFIFSYLITITANGDVQQYVSTTNSLNVTGYIPKQTVTVTSVQVVVQDLNGKFYASAGSTAVTFTTNDSPVTNVILGTRGVSCSYNGTVNATSKGVVCTWTVGTVPYKRLNLRLYCRSPSERRPFNRKAQLFLVAGATQKTSYFFAGAPTPAKCEIKMGVYYTKSDNVNAKRNLKPSQEIVKFSI
jgi:hypothetical protein